MRVMLLASTAAILALPTLVNAQTAPPKMTPLSGAQPPELQEVIVTAQRRAETLEHAAVPVQVLSRDQIVEANLTQIEGLSRLAPALSVQQGGTGAVLFMRGVGNFTVAPTADPALAFNYDGVYMARPTSTTGMFYDLERIEVLKGPQGTLYGRNATGGAINIIPAQPEIGRYAGYVTASYGNYNAIIAEGAVNIPLGENAAFRVSADTSRHDGYLKDGTSDDRTTGVRAQVKANLTSDLTVRLAADYSHTGGVGSGISMVGNYVFNPATKQYVLRPSGLPLDEGLYTPAAQAYRQTVTAGGAGRTLDVLTPGPFVDSTFYGVNAEIAYDLGPGVLTIIPAWRVSRPTYLTGAADFDYLQHERDEQSSVEARFAGTRIGMFDYNLGAYYFDENIRQETALSLSNAATWLNEKLTTKSYAVFGRVTAHLTDQLRIVGGLRYTKDDKTFLAGVTAPAVVCVRVVAGVPTCPTAPLIPLVRNPSDLPFALPAVGGPPLPLGTSGAIIARSDSAYDTGLKSHFTSYHAGVEYDLASSSMLYANIESGYHSGGFAAAAGFETYQPEYLTAYTLGAKSRLFDNRLQTSLEGFIWRYSGQQVSHVGVDLNGRTANFTQNIGKTHIEGFEAEAKALLTADDLVSADIQYLHTEAITFAYQQSVVPNAPPLTGCPYTVAANPALYTVNCAGFPAYNSPRWTINLAAQHTFHLGENKIVVGADTQYKSSQYIGFNYLPSQLAPAAWNSNAQLMFAPSDERWSVSFFIRNFTDNRIVVFSATHPTANILTDAIAPPRTYGVRISAHY